MVKNDLNWLIGGAQGSGVDSSATIFARACNYAGLHVFGKREYYSNIMGEHSYYVVGVKDSPIRSSVEYVDLISVYDAESIVRHVRSIAREGGVIYDSRITNTKLKDIPTLDERLLIDTEQYLRNKGLGNTVQDMLEDAKRKSVKLYPMPYSDLLKQVSSKSGESRISVLSKMTNTMAVAASLSLLRLDINKLKEAISETFIKKPKVVEMNILAAQITYDFVAENYSGRFNHRLESVVSSDKKIFLMGSQAVALGKLLGGCRFQSYYPISPSTDESTYLESHSTIDTFTQESDKKSQVRSPKMKMSQDSIIVTQAEDEIAAITMATGASITGTRASTSTSGPGFSLMVEGLGWAAINEVPVVVTLYQRGGPSTGMPTRQEQGDLKFALNSGHGEFPQITIASGDLKECFYDAANAFNYAERYQVPVIHIVDKNLASTTSTEPLYETKDVNVDRGKILTEGLLEKMLDNKEKYSRFKFTEDGISPRTFPGMRGGNFWLTGDEHDEMGHITEDPVIRVRMMEKRMKKSKVAGEQIPLKEKINFFGPEDAEATIVSWGSTKGVILDVLDKLLEDGRLINFLQIRLMNPFPSEYVSKVLRKSQKRINIEMNYGGQLGSLIKEQTGQEMDHSILKYNGRAITLEELYNSLKKVILDGEPGKVVLTDGA